MISSTSLLQRELRVWVLSGNKRSSSCWAAFSVFDRNGDGNISKEELKQVLESEEVEGALGTKAIAELMLEVDSNGDGMIDFAEFMGMMK